MATLDRRLNSDLLSASKCLHPKTICLLLPSFSLRLLLVGKPFLPPCQGSLSLPPDLTWRHQDSALNCAAMNAPTVTEVPFPPCTSRHWLESAKSSTVILPLVLVFCFCFSNL